LVKVTRALGAARDMLRMRLGKISAAERRFLPLIGEIPGGPVALLEKTFKLEEKADLVTLQNKSQNVEELQLSVLHICLDVFAH